MKYAYCYLRSDVIRCSAKCFCSFIAHNAFFAHAEIGDFNVTVLVQQYVVQFQISVYDTVQVQIEQSDRYFRGIKSATTIQKYNFTILLKPSQCRNKRNIVNNTNTATGSLNFPHCWIWNIKSPPFIYSMTKYRRSWKKNTNQRRYANTKRKKINNYILQYRYYKC